MMVVGYTEVILLNSNYFMSAANLKQVIGSAVRAFVELFLLVRFLSENEVHNFQSYDHDSHVI